MVRRTLLISTLACGLVVAGCSSNPDAEGADPTITAAATAATTTTSEPPATSVAETTTSTVRAAAFRVTTDMLYMTVNGIELLTNVYEPTGEGPWPVVVSLHGVSAEGKDDPELTVVARQAAAAGMLVFTPTWLSVDQFPITLETMEIWEDIQICAVAFAQQNAARFNGDSTTTVVDGFSAGAGGALGFASAHPRTDPVPGCETDALPTPVKGFVLGDGEYWLHSENFDGVFASDPDAVQARLASLIGPGSWETNPDAEFFLWVAANGTKPREIGDASDPSGWFARRDFDGSIQADLERLDEFADGVVTYVDAGRLLALRLSEAGFDVTFDEYPGDHTTRDKVPELVRYLKAATSR